MYGAVNDAVGVAVPNLAELLARALVLGAARAAQSMLLYLTRAPLEAGSEALLAPTVGLMGVLFAVAPDDVAPVDEET